MPASAGTLEAARNSAESRMLRTENRQGRATAWRTATARIGSEPRRASTKQASAKQCPTFAGCVIFQAALLYHELGMRLLQLVHALDLELADAQLLEVRQFRQDGDVAHLGARDIDELELGQMDDVLETGVGDLGGKGEIEAGQF